MVLSLTTGCASTKEGRFDAQPATPTPTCQKHQSQEPGTRYTDSENSDPMSVLEMMRFYTANGAKAYCDGKPATATDRQWTRLYRALGGDPSHVPTGN
ncbi:hypothetical protein [Kitasatospora azatica]|uniref:hypothetical protein n=1 Tax=Kitasatospora azatica TaxID=58347 RepID=UPI000568C015|nr:hypothetical protein [Kitasatospora azatica]